MTTQTSQAAEAAERPITVGAAMKQMRDCFIDVTIHSQRAYAVCDYIEQLEDALRAELTSPQVAAEGGTVSESIYSGSMTIPLALVQHIERRPHGQYMVVMKSSTYNTEFDDYNNAPCLDKDEGPRFLTAWCRYRAELEAATLRDLSPASRSAGVAGGVDASREPVAVGEPSKYGSPEMQSLILAKLATPPAQVDGREAGPYSGSVHLGSGAGGNVHGRAVVSAYSIQISDKPFAEEITVQRMRQIDGTPLWSVKLGGNCLNKSGEWEWEPMPSSRDDEFLARCRFESPEAAIDAAILSTKGTT